MNRNGHLARVVANLVLVAHVVHICAVEPLRFQGCGRLGAYARHLPGAAVARTQRAGFSRSPHRAQRGAHAHLRPFGESPDRWRWAQDELRLEGCIVLEALHQALQCVHEGQGGDHHSANPETKFNSQHRLPLVFYEAALPLLFKRPRRWCSSGHAATLQRLEIRLIEQMFDGSPSGL